MIQLNQVYKCNVCGNIVGVLHGAEGVLVCCKKEMILQEENIVDASREKHVPVIEKIENGFRVKIGEINHPMGEGHYIEWIEILVDGRVIRKNLDPGDEAIADFCTEAQVATARAYCNLHGLWKK